MIKAQRLTKRFDGNLAVDVPGQMVFELNDPDELGKRHFVLTGDIAVSFDRQVGQAIEMPRLTEETDE